MLTEEQRTWLKNLNEQGCTDTDLYCFCKDNDIPVKEASRYMAELNAPPQCHGCKNIESYGMYGGMYPCSVCSRICKDMYEGEGNNNED